MHHNRARKYVIAAAKWALVVAVLWGMHRTIRSALADLEQHQWSAASLSPGWLIVSAVAYLAGVFPQALFWHRLLSLFGQPAPLARTIRAWYVGSLGKYVPGKATVIVLRTALVRSNGVGIAVSTATIFYETLTTMAVGALVAGAILLVMRHDHWQWTVLSAGLMVVAGADRAVDFQARGAAGRHRAPRPPRSTGSITSARAASRVLGDKSARAGCWWA